MQPKKTTTRAAMIGIIAMLLIVTLATTSTANEPDNHTTWTFSGYGPWEWWDLTGPPEQYTDIAAFSLDLTCYGVSCEGEAYVDGAFGSASCFIEYGDDIWHGTIKVLNRVGPCGDLFNIQDGPAACIGGQTCIGERVGFRVMNGAGAPGAALGGEGRGYSL